MKPVRIAQPASDESTEAGCWYEATLAGLGGDFYEPDDFYIVGALARRRPGAGNNERSLFRLTQIR